MTCSRVVTCGTILAVVLTVCLLNAPEEAAGAAPPDEGRSEPIYHQLTPLTFGDQGARAAKARDGAQKDGHEGDAAATSVYYDVLRYRLDLKIDPDAESIDGTMKMVFASDHAALDQVVLDLSTALNVSMVDHLSGSLAFTHAGDSLSVTLPAALDPTDIDSFTVHYGGIPRQDVNNRGLMFGDYVAVAPFDAGPVIASMSQAAFANFWWPCKDRPGDKALSIVSLTVPDNLVAVSNGELIDESPAEPGWRTYTWQENYPIASYLISVAISDYVLVQEDCSTTLGTAVPLRNWVFPPDEVAATADFAPLCEMMDHSEGLFGEYPFVGEKYGHAEFLWSGGGAAAMEHQTVTSIAQAAITGELRHDGLVIHELAHMWFGDSVTPDSWADIWLNEGFARYAEVLWTETEYGQLSYFGHMQNLRPLVDDWRGHGTVYNASPVLNRVVYDKGAWILHMLRGRLGDADFFDLLMDWANDSSRKHGTVTTEDFIVHASTYSDHDLHAFFDPYLNVQESPRLVFSPQVGDGPNGADTRLTVTLRQVQATLFDNIYPIRVATSGGVETVRMRVAAESVTEIFDLQNAITTVELDPQEWVVWLPADAPLTYEGLVSAYPNPAFSYVTIAYRLESAAPVTLRIYDVRGREVYRRDLGVVTPPADPDEPAEFGWNLAAKGGGRVASGVYWATVEIDGNTTVGKFTVVH